MGCRLFLMRTSGKRGTRADPRGRDLHFYSLIVFPMPCRSDGNFGRSEKEVAVSSPWTSYTASRAPILRCSFPITRLLLPVMFGGWRLPEPEKLQLVGCEASIHVMVLGAALLPCVLHNLVLLFTRS
jgi:hypothetical protein